MASWSSSLKQSSSAYASDAARWIAASQLVEFPVLKSATEICEVIFKSAKRVSSMAWIKPTSIMFFVLALLSLTGALLLLSITAINSIWDGSLELTSDSVQYVAAALNILELKDPLRYEGPFYIAWPPLYPTIIAVVYGVGRVITDDVIHLMRYFNVILFSIVIFISGLMFLRYTKSRMIALFGTVAIITSPVLYVSHLLWSELVFTLLIMLFLLVLEILTKKPSYRLLLASSVLAAMIALQRYAGIIAIGCGVITILFCLYKISFLQRLRYVVVFVVISATPVALWMLRNYIHTGLLSGNRAPSKRPLLENIDAMWSLLQSWFVPQAVAVLVAVIIVFALLYLIFIVIRQYRWRDNQLLIKLEQVIPLPVTIFTLVYMLFLLITLSIFDQGAISLQYLMPVYIPLLLLICVLVDRFSLLVRWPAVIKLLLSFWIAGYVMPSSFSEVQRLVQDCCPTAWRHSELVDWLEIHAPELSQPIYATTPLSNYRGIRVQELPRELYQLTMLEPRRHYAPPTADGIHVVWYNDDQHRHCTRCYGQHYLLQDFAGLFNLALIAELNDGSVYFVTPKAES